MSLRRIEFLIAVMAAYAESSASFRNRALQIQLKPDHIDALFDNDIKSFNHLVFAVLGERGQLDQQRFDELLDVFCVQAGPRLEFAVHCVSCHMNH